MIYKSIVLSSLVLLSFLFSDVLVCKGEGVDNLRLDADYNSILDYQDTQICVDEKDPFCTEKKDVVKYLYITDKIVADELTEWIDERTANMKVYEENGKKIYRVYAGQPFIKTGDVWYETGTNNVDKATWDSYVGSATIGRIIEKLNPLKIYSLKAQTYYAGAGDGAIYKTNASWDTAHDATDGTDFDYTTNNNNSHSGKAGSLYSIKRLFLPFDTSALATDINIGTATLNVWAVDSGFQDNCDNDGDDFYTIVETSQPNNAQLSNADFDLCGAVNNPTELTDTRVDITSLQSTSDYFSFDLNTAGISAIDPDGYTLLGIREGHDVLDSPLTCSDNQYSYVHIRMSEYAGTTYDPYLEIIEEEAEQGTTTATSTVYATNCTPDITNDLGIINACSYASSTTGITYTNYHWPFIVWLVIILPILIILPRVLTELTILFRGYGD